MVVYLKAYHVEVVVVVLWVVVHWGNMTRFLVPVTMEVVGHDSDPVHVLVNGRYVVAWRGKVNVQVRKHVLKLLIFNKM